ncbi:MAG TPA: sulfite exporter TauE/SafE family protein [Clostridiales bacterium]|nr:sulfite exporter TauE/SafE family protein [Clostridiales bacterium]
MKKQKTSKKDNQKHKKSQIGKKIMLLLLGGMIGFINGFFGGGGGMICVPTLEKALKLDNKRAHATAIAVIFPLSLISCAIYIFKGSIQSLPLLTVGLGVLAGGIAGSISLKYIPSKVLRIIFAIIMFVGGVRLVI